MVKKVFKNIFTLSVVAKVIIFLFISAVTLANVTFFLQYMKLNSSPALYNFRAEVISPISIGNNDPIKAIGTYDRDIMCEMTTFRVHLRNHATNDILTLGPTHLRTSPPMNLQPGKNIPIQFELFQPTNIYPGMWFVDFDGQYICREGIFVVKKEVHLNSNAISVTE